MFTLPVGNFVQTTSVFRPSSVVDTPGSGTITTSANAYDGDPGTFGFWTSASNSIYGCVGATVLNGKKLYCLSLNSTIQDEGVVTLYLSVDNGATYLYQTTIPKTLSVCTITIPDFTTISNVKIKIVAPNFIIGATGYQTYAYIYDLYIQ